MSRKRKRNGPPPVLSVPKYIEAVRRLAVAADLPPGSVTMVEVQHQDGCPLLTGTGPCTCSSPAARFRNTS